MSSTRVRLNTFKPRPYQQELFDAWDAGITKFFMVWPRRFGKDISCFNVILPDMLKERMLVLYALPTFQQARRCIWDAIDISGKKMLDYWPAEVISKINHSEQKITLINGSIFSLIGAENYDRSIVGSNAKIIIISEAAVVDDLDSVLNYASPILAANGGKLILQSTPRGKNAFYHLYNSVKDNPDWFVSLKTVNDYDYIPAEVLATEKERMGEGLYAQEYLCSFERGQQGIIMGYELDKMKRDGRFTILHHDPSALVHVVFDLGWSDPTAIIYFQVFGNPSNPTEIRIIDCFSDNHLGLDYYVNKIRENTHYRLGTIFGPHDMRVHEIGNGGRSRLHMVQEMGMDMTILDQQDKENSIEQTLATLPRVWIDTNNCQKLMDALENYRREYDDKNQIYKKDTIRNWAAHYADAVRYMCQAVKLLGPSLDSDEFDRKRREALYGNRSNYFGPLRPAKRF